MEYLIQSYDETAQYICYSVIIDILSIAKGEAERIEFKVSSMYDFDYVCGTDETFIQYLEPVSLWLEPQTTPVIFLSFRMLQDILYKHLLLDICHDLDLVDFMSNVSTG